MDFALTPTQTKYRDSARAFAQTRLARATGTIRWNQAPERLASARRGPSATAPSSRTAPTSPPQPGDRPLYPAARSGGQRVPMRASKVRSGPIRRCRL